MISSVSSNRFAALQTDYTQQQSLAQTKPELTFTPVLVGSQHLLL